MDGYIRGKPDLSWWLTQNSKGVEFRKKHALEDKWPEWREMYRGNWRPGVVPSNVFFRMLRTVVPRIYFRNPSISIIPGKPGLEHMVLAKLLERVDNKMIRQMKLKRQIKGIVQDTFKFGTGIGKLGFGAQATPTPVGDGIRPVGKKGETFEYDAKKIDSMPWFGRVSPGNFVVPPGCTELSEARWTGEWLKRSEEDIKADPMLENTNNITSGQASSSLHAPRRPLGTSEMEGMVDLFEVRDKKTRKAMLFAPFRTDKPLFFGDDALQVHGGVPYFGSVFNDDEESFWGTPDSQILEPHQLEVNEIRTQQMKHRRLSPIKLLVQKNTMDENEAEKLVNEDVCPVVWTKDNPSTTVMRFEPADIPQGLLTAEAIVMQDVRETLGFGRNQFGEFSEGKSKRTTAHEAEIVRLASEIRIDERRDMIADLLTDVIQMMHTIIFTQWHSEQIIDVIGPFGIPIWVKFRPDILRVGSYDVKIDPDSSLPETKQLREQKAFAMYERLKTNPLIDPVQLTLYLLHEIHGVNFDSMMKGIPQGLGSQQNPVSVGQFSQLLGQAGQAGQQLLPAQGGA